MRIFLITQWFPPEHAPVGHMVFELASDLVKLGHEVTVVTGFPNHPSGIVFEGYRKRLLQEEYINGVRVWRVYSLTSPRRTFFNRMLTSLSFALIACLTVLFRSKCDVIFSILQPLTIGLVVPFTARIKGIPLVFSVQDLHPDVLVELGLIKNRSIIRLLRWVESHSYRSADRVTVICEHFRNHVVARGVSADRVEVIENWVDLDDIQPGSKINDFRRVVGFSSDDWVVLYAGTIGFISGAGIVLDVAGKLSGMKNIKFLFVGEGPLVDELKSSAKSMSLDNVVFAPFQERKMLNNVQATADISLVTMRKNKGTFSMPSKVLGYMAAARPVVASVDSDSATAMQIIRAKCGIQVPAEDADAMADAIVKLYESKELCEEFGRNGRDFLEKNLNRKTAVEKYNKLLKGFQ